MPNSARRGRRHASLEAQPIPTASTTRKNQNAPALPVRRTMTREHLLNLTRTKYDHSVQVTRVAIPTTRPGLAAALQPPITNRTLICALETSCMTVSICIFCGSQPGADPRFRAAATRLGELAGAAGLKVIYGG